MSVTDTFLQCCLRHLNVQQVDREKALDLARVIQTLDLTPAILSVGIIFVYKYQHNSINSLAFDKSDLLPYFIIIASLVLSNKYLNDQSYTLKTWQGVLSKYSKFDVSLGMLNQLEQNVLVSMDYVLNVKHDPLLWAPLADLDQAHVSALRYNVAVTASPTSSPYNDHAPVPMSSPPLVATTSPMTYASNASYNSTPNMGGPVTPVSLPGRKGIAYYASPPNHFASTHLASNYVPFQFTPLHMPGYQGWDQPQRKDMMAMHMDPGMALFPGSH